MKNKKIIGAIIIGVILLIIAGIGVSNSLNAKHVRITLLGSELVDKSKYTTTFLKELEVEFSGKVTIEVLDLWKDQQVKAKYPDVKKIPSLIFYDKNGKELKRNEGFLEKAEIKEIIKDELGIK